MDYSKSEEIMTVIRNYGIDIPGLIRYVDLDKFVFRLFGVGPEAGTSFVKPKRANVNGYPYKLSKGATGTTGTAAVFCTNNTDAIVTIGTIKCMSINHVVQYCLKNNLSNVRPLIVDIITAAKQYKTNPSSIDPLILENNRLREKIAFLTDALNKLTGANIEQPPIIPLPEVKKERQYILSEKTAGVIDEFGRRIMYKFDIISIEEILLFVPRIFHQELKDNYGKFPDNDGEILFEATLIVPKYSSKFIDILEDLPDCTEKTEVISNDLMKKYTQNTMMAYCTGKRGQKPTDIYGDEWVFIVFGNDAVKYFIQ